MTASVADAADVLIDGPWEHRMLSAGGVRFHVAIAGSGPLIVLLHGFPQMWWAWRHQLAALPQQGFRIAAVDLRGYGASDKPPRGYDSFTMASDTAALIRTLGEPAAHIVGHGIGGAVTWAMPTLERDVTRSITVLATPHPLAMRKASLRNRDQVRANGWMWPYQRPLSGESDLTDPKALTEVMAGWSGQRMVPDRSDVERYAQAFAQPFAAHCAAESVRWFSRMAFTPTGIRLSKQLRSRIAVPAMLIHGSQDTCTLPATARMSARYVSSGLERHELAGVGHFPHEEDPGAVNDLLAAFVARHA